MARYLLFHNSGSYKFDWTWIDKWCAMYGVHPVVIDPTQRQKDTPPYCFPDLDTAVAHPDFAGHAWYWLREDGTYWDDPSVTPLPQDDVVYCLGCDYNGFGAHACVGTHIRLRPPSPDFDGSWFASMVVPLLLFEVYG